MFVSGTSTQKVGEVAQTLLGVTPRASSVSRLNHTRTEHFETWRERPLLAHSRILYLDGVLVQGPSGHHAPPDGCPFGAGSSNTTIARGDALSAQFSHATVLASLPTAPSAPPSPKKLLLSCLPESSFCRMFFVLTFSILFRVAASIREAKKDHLLRSVAKN
jgi:Transposase, Mutator family